jgi:anti-sigma regulatory factor (Ser/Thr protein kinase)
MTELRLPPSTESVPVARRFARDQLRRSGADVDTVVLLVSEVVTNAVLHARSDVVLSVADRGEVARVEVGDASPMPPHVHRFAVESATGRGLRLLDQLSLRWGTTNTAAGRGKVVWFEVGSPDDDAWTSFTDDLLSERARGDF